MAQLLKLEVFETPESSDVPVFLLPEQVEDIRLNAYERGYGAGWDDGEQQIEATAAAQRDTIARQIEQLNFTYVEAQTHVLRALEPLFESLLSIVLPSAACASVIPLTIEQLLPLVQTAAEAPITLRIASGSQARFEAAFEGLVLPPLSLVETDDLVEGQAELSFETAQSRIDLTHAADAMRQAIERFYQIQNEEILSA